MAPRPRVHAALAVQSAATLGVVAAATVASHAFAGPEAATPWNVGIGISAGIVLVSGLRLAPAVVAGSLLGAWAIGWPSGTVSGTTSIVLGALLAVVVGAGLRRVMARDPGEWVVRDVLMLLAGGLLAAAGAVASMWVRTFIGAGTGLDASFAFALAVGVAVGVTLGVPAVASAVRLGRLTVAVRVRAAPAADILVHALFTFAVGAAGYLLKGPTGERFWSLYFIPLLWTAFRFGMHGVIAAQVLVSLQAIALAVIVATPASALVNYHFFLFNFTVTGLLLAAALGARRDAVRARHRSDALLTGAFRIMDDGVVLLRSRDGMIIDVNDAWSRLVGMPRSGLVGRSVFDLPVWGEDTSAALRASLQRGRPVREQSARIARDDGVTRDVVVVAEPVADDDDAFIVAFVRDVTESRIVARQRLQSQKLEAVGLLAGGVAHDFNNILTVVTAAGTLLKEEIPPGDPRQEDVASILDAASRGAQLTRQLLTFSRQGSSEASRVHDAGVLIGDMVGLLGRLLGGGVQIVTELDHGVEVVAPPGQLEQVVLNLAVNARDAMDGRGTIRIAVATRDLDAPTFVPEVSALVRAGRWGVVTVSDTGAGIDDANLARIFEPFFTTKAEGKGTGLGLSTVYGIMQAVAGHVGVRSEPGRGTTFVVYWPAGCD